MILNDVCDLRFDIASGSRRPLATGAIPWSRALLVSLVLIAVGVGVLAPLGKWSAVFGLLLVASILLYNLLHHRWSGAVIFMGLCRILVYAVAAASVAYPFDLHIFTKMGGGLFLYILLLTIVARREDRTTPGLRRNLAWMLPPLGIAAGVICWPGIDYIVIVLGVLYVLWTVYAICALYTQPPRMRHAVMSLIAGICLLDAYNLAVLGQPVAACVAVALFVVTVAGHTKVSGT